MGFRKSEFIVLSYMKNNHSYEIFILLDKKNPSYQVTKKSSREFNVLIRKTENIEIPSVIKFLNYQFCAKCTNIFNGQL